MRSTRRDPPPKMLADTLAIIASMDLFMLGRLACVNKNWLACAERNDTWSRFIPAAHRHAEYQRCYTERLESNRQPHEHNEWELIKRGSINKAIFIRNLRELEAVLSFRFSSKELGVLAIHDCTWTPEQFIQLAFILPYTMIHRVLISASAQLHSPTESSHVAQLYNATSLNGILNACLTATYIGDRQVQLRRPYTFIMPPRWSFPIEKEILPRIACDNIYANLTCANSPSVPIDSVDKQPSPSEELVNLLYQRPGMAIDLTIFIAHQSDGSIYEEIIVFLTSLVNGHPIATSFCLSLPLSLQDTTIMRSLLELLKLCSLRHQQMTLQLTVDPKQAAVAECFVLLFDALENIRCISYLDLSYIPLGNARLQQLASILPKTKIKTLILTKTRLSDISSLCEILHRTLIDTLDLRDNDEYIEDGIKHDVGITDATPIITALSHAKCRLKTLLLNRCKFNGTYFSLLQCLPNNSSLDHLSLQHCEPPGKTSEAVVCWVNHLAYNFYLTNEQVITVSHYSPPREEQITCYLMRNSLFAKIRAAIAKCEAIGFSANASIAAPVIDKELKQAQIDLARAMVNDSHARIRSAYRGNHIPILAKQENCANYYIRLKKKLDELECKLAAMRHVSVTRKIPTIQAAARGFFARQKTRELLQSPIEENYTAFKM